MTTYIRLDQIRKAATFTDNLTSAAIQTIETDAVDSEDFLGGQLSQIKQIVGATKWYDPIQNSATDPRSLKTLTDGLWFKDMMRWRIKIQDVAIPAGQNYVVLNVAATEGPQETAAVGAGSAQGAIVATATTFGAHNLDLVAGLSVLNPKNLCLIRDAASQDPILSSNRAVMGLLQSETGVVDGDVFDDTSKRVQISFVRANATGDGLEACPVADIAGLSINYQYGSRTELNLANEQDFQYYSFSDPSSTSSITLQQAYVGGNAISVQTSEGNLVFDLSQDLTSYQVQRGSASFLTLTRNDTTGDVIVVDSDQLDINLTSTADISSGLAVNSSVQAINLGVTSGQVDSTSLVVRSTAGDLSLTSADDILFTTVRQTALPLDDATSGAISALPGGPYTSVAAAIRAALTSSQLDVYTQVLTSNYARDANVPGATETWSPALDLSARTIDRNAPAVPDTLVFLNGSLLNGGNATINNDVYLGTNPAQGDLRYDFPKGVRIGDTITVISWKAS